MAKMLKLNNKGAVSMLSVTVVSIILTLVSTAYIRAVTVQQKDAISYDQSSRAFFAAESGVQDAIRASDVDEGIRASGKDQCRPYGDSGNNGNGQLGPSGYDLSYTCQLIDSTPSNITGFAATDGNNPLIKITPNTPQSGSLRIQFRWSAITDSTEETLYPRLSTSAVFPPNDSWNAINYTDNPIHPVVRLNIISPRRTQISKSNTYERVLFLNPTSTPGSIPVISASDSADIKAENTIVQSSCVASDGSSGTGFGGYSCQRVLKLEGFDLSSRDLYVGLSTVYGATDFSVQLQQGDSPYSAIELRSNQMLVDVTAQSGGNTFRRVRQAIPLSDYNQVQGSNYSLVSTEGICKLYAIGDTDAQYSQGCAP